MSYFTIPLAVQIKHNLRLPNITQEVILHLREDQPVMRQAQNMVIYVCT